MAKRLKIAVVGTGAIVERAHLPGLTVDGNVEIHLCGRNQARLKELSSRFSIEKTFLSLDECLKRVAIDGVIIASPNFLHGEHAFLAIGNGLPILLEKPIAHEITIAREIIARARARNIPVQLNLPQPQRPTMRALLALTQGGYFGPIRSVEVAMMRTSGIPGFGTWFTRKRTAGGGVLADLGPHMLDLALRLAGDFKAEIRSATIWSDFGPKGRGLGDWTAHRDLSDNAAEQFDVEDRARLELVTVGAASVTCDVAWAYHGPNEDHVKIVGEDGGAQYLPSISEGNTALSIYPIPTEPRSFEPDHDRLEDPWIDVVRGFLSTVRGEERKSYAYEALSVAELIAAAYTMANGDGTNNQGRREWRGGDG